MSDMPDFNAEKLGSGKEIVERLSNLIAVFENWALMDRFMPNWHSHRDQLNQLPVRHEEWGY